MFEDPKEYKVLSQCGSKREGEPLAGGRGIADVYGGAAWQG